MAPLIKYKRFLFARPPSGIIVPGGPPCVLVSVDAMTKDAAISRLLAAWPTVPKAAWDLLDELDPETHTLGRLGEHLPFMEIH